MLIEDEAVNGEIQLDGLRTSIGVSTSVSSENNNDLLAQVKKNREKKEKVKRRIRKAEKIMFAIFVGVALGLILVATLATAFRDNLAVA